MRNIVFFLEEPSAQEMLEGLLSKIVPPEINIRYLVFRGKQDLEKNLFRRLRGWILPNTSFLVLRDQDSGDCAIIKKKLADICESTGKKGVLVRIACRELESFYLGDLEAVEKGLEINSISSLQGKKKYKNPDRLENPSEELYRLTKNKYQKRPGSRAIAPHLKLEGNKSHSFCVLLEGIRKLTVHDFAE